MSTISMDRRQEMFKRLEVLFVYFRSSMVSNLQADELHSRGVDICQFNLVEETNRGSKYFRPMLQEHLDTFDMQPPIPRLSFDDSYPTENDAYVIWRAIYDQLFCLGYPGENEGDILYAYEFTSWKPVGLVQLIRIPCIRLADLSWVKTLLSFRRATY